MASLIGSLFVSLTADFNPLQRNMKTAEGVVSSTTSGMRRSVGLTEKSVSSFQKTMNSNIRPYALLQAGKAFDTVSSRAGLLRGALFATTAAFGGLAAAISTNVFSRYVDQFTSLQNQLRVTSSGTADLNAQMDQLQKVSERSRSSLTAIGVTYARLAKASPEEGAANTLRRVETIAKGLQLGGATAQEAYSATIQLSQGLASNRLGGEELRAVLETPLGNELAKGLGVSIAKFREMSIAGQLTAKKIYQALDARAGAIDKAFNETTSTIDQALSVLDSRIIAYAGSVDKAYGITKLLTGGINAFGNNLSTILPLLGQAAIGIGALYAGRLAGGRVGGGVGALVGGIKAVTDARKESLRIAKEDVATARVALNAAKAQAAETRKKAEDPLSAAPKSAVNAYKRDLAAIERADEAYLKVLGQKARLNQELYEVTRTASAGELRASAAIAAQQEKINGLKQASIALRRKEQSAEAAVTGASGLQSTSTAKVKQLADANRNLLRVQKEQLAIAGSIQSAETSLAATRANYTKQYDAAFTAAANKRAALLVAEKRYQADVAAAEAKRVSAVAAARSSGAAARGVGGAAIAQEIGLATRSVGAAEQAVTRAGTVFEAARRASSGLAVGIGLVGRAGASLVGFLGGPWGVAFTAAIGIMTLLGIRSQESAEKIANAQKLINDTIAEERERGGENNLAETPDVNAALIAQKIEEQRKLVDTASEELARLRSGVVEDLNSLVNVAATLPGGDDAVDRVRDIARAFAEGGISIDEVKGKLRDIGFSNDAIKGIGDEMKASKGQIDLATRALEILQSQLNRLNGQQARVTVTIDVNDPNGMLNASFLDKQFDREAKERADMAARNAARGGMQSSSRNANILADRQQADILKAADDRGQKIRDRAQALLEENNAYGLTRDAAMKWAEAELSTSEATKAAKKESKEAASEASKAAKEYEKFANKLAELQETAAASGLSDLDQKVVNFATTLKNGAAMMKQYTDAIKAGDLSKAPPELLQARDAFQQIGAGEAAKGIIEQYGRGAQVAQLFADKQQQLNMAVANGQITAQQAGVAFGDFVASFGQYEWVDGLSGAITNFASTALNDFENIGDAAAKLLDDIAQILLKAALLDPLQQSLTSFFGGGAAAAASGGGGGGFGGLIGSLFGSIFHEGGKVGSTKAPTRAVPASTFKGAPKFHSGLGSQEMAAILKRGETVLTENQAGSWTNTMSGLANKASKNAKPPAKADLNVNINGATGNAEIREMVQKGVVAGLEVYDRSQLPDSIAKYQNDPNARG